MREPRASSFSSFPSSSLGTHVFEAPLRRAQVGIRRQTVHWFISATDASQIQSQGVGSAFFRNWPARTSNPNEETDLANSEKTRTRPFNISARSPDKAESSRRRGEVIVDPYAELSALLSRQGRQSEIRSRDLSSLARATSVPSRTFHELSRIHLPLLTSTSRRP